MLDHICVFIDKHEPRGLRSVPVDHPSVTGQGSGWLTWSSCDSFRSLQCWFAFTWMQARNPNSMESFQDGGQQNMKSEQHEYPAMDGSRLNPEMNSFPHTSGDSAMGPDNFPKSSDGMHPNAMQNYPGYNRGNYGIGDQHGGTMADYNNQNSQFSGQFSQTPVRSPYSGVPKSSMASVRPGMMPPGIGMMPGSYSTSQRMMSTNQNGPTPTLNQLLQTSSSGQRYPGNYSDFSGTPGKAGEMNSGSSSYPVPHGWNGNPRALGPYPQGSIPGSPYRHQVINSFLQFGPCSPWAVTDDKQAHTIQWYTNFIA